MSTFFRKIKFRFFLVLLLISCMIAGLIPTSVYAATYGDSGYDTTSQGDFLIDGNIILTYVTGDGGTIERISGSDDDSTQQYRAVPSDNWEFGRWSTYYVGPTTEDSNPMTVSGDYYFSQPGNGEKLCDKTHPVIQVNEEFWAAGVYYLHAIFEPKVTVSVKNRPEKSSISIHGTSPSTVLDNVFISGDSGGVPYGGEAKVTLTGVTDDYLLESISVNDGVERNDFTYEAGGQIAVFFKATRPTRVQINLKIKEQTVLFDANTGTGTMEAQVFESGIEETINAAGFVKKGYLFDGWNTKADGSGEKFTDQQKVIFKPENDKDTLTLYAQWKECTNHNAADGACTECGAEHDHDFTYESKDNVITERCSNNCNHNATATLEQDSSVSTTYTGEEIEVLKVIYSENWEGGTLDITYSNNINAGTTASGSITKGTATAVKAFDIEKVKAPVIEFPTMDKPLTKGQKLKKTKLTFNENEYGEFGWADPDMVPESDGEYVLEFYPSDQALNNYDWTDDVRWDAEQNVLSESVFVEVIKAKNDGTGKEPGNTQSTQTGDSSNLWFWTIALIASGGCTVKFTQNVRRRRYNREE